MILQQTDNYIKACMKTWLLCESCIHIEETTSYHPRQSLITKWRSCAHSCFTIVCSIIRKENEEMQEPALTCMLSCRECYKECEKYKYIDDIEYCGEVCRYCADIIKDLLLPEYLN